jgi:nucleotide-binding universal stress UspA family protein
MPFERLLVAVDCSAGAQKALEKGVELARLTGASLLALAVEGRLPAYAATIAEVGEVRREKDSFFSQLARSARDYAREHGVDLEVDVRPGHAAELIVPHAREREVDLIVLGHKGPLPQGLPARVDRRPGRAPRALPR